MWCHLPTGFNRRSLLHYVALASLFIAFFTTLFLATTSHAAPGINQTLSFQGRLLNSSGGVVPDGNYNLQFKIYQDGAGTAINNPGGTLKWTETYINNGGTNGVLVKNGLFSVNLGSVTPFGTSVDWNQDTIWLSMNVAGSAAACVTYGTAPCASDGEMLPMKRMTAVPFAINSSQLGGKSADNFLQLAQGVQTDASTNSSSIHIDKTGTGNLIQLQNNGKDVFNVTNSGDIELGSGATRNISVGTATSGNLGDNLSIRAGSGGSGAGSTGGSLVLQGGEAGGANADGGAVAIEGGNGSGTGSVGSIFVGSSNNAGVQIGNTNLASGEQTIVIGTNANAGGRSNVIIGATEDSGGGITRIQSKENTTIATDGVDRATFDTEGALTLGNGVSSSTPTDFKIQGTASSASGVSGGNLTVQGGNATTGNANGGNITLSGGSGSGSGANGLVVLTTPTYATVENDANCYTGGATVATNCTIAQSSVDNSSAIIVGFNTADQIATLPDPTLTTAGRVVYVSAANGSQVFKLRVNQGEGENIEQYVPMFQNTTATMFWNGSNWTVAGASGATTLQNAYDAAQSINGNGTAEILSYGYGLTVKNGNATANNSTLFDVQSSSATKIFSVNSGTNDYSVNGGAEVAGATSTEFPTNDWGVAGVATVNRYTTKGNYIESGNASVEVSSSGAYSGGYNKLRQALKPSTTYTVSLSARLESGTFTSFGVLYVRDGSNVSATCQDNITLSTTSWTKVKCTFQTPASGITSDNTIAFGQLTAGDHDYYIDNMSVTEGDMVNGSGTTRSNVQIGEGVDSDEPTLFSLDRSTAPPTSVDDAALLGSMYYDTTAGKVQCFEAEGWGDCGTPPDTFVTLSPEFAGGIVTGSGTGTMKTDICSDQLNVNDGSSAQPTVCGTNETYNYYNWTSPSATDQYKIIYVNYQLPQNFKQFIGGATSVMGRTDSTNSTAVYQFFRNDPVDGLVACSTEQSISTGVQALWQKGTPGGAADPTACGFEAGDTLVAKIVLGAKSNANSYISNLSFAHSVK